jgi:O-antigen ligase
MLRLARPPSMMRSVIDAAVATAPGTSRAAWAVIALGLGGSIVLGAAIARGTSAAVMALGLSALIVLGALALRHPSYLNVEIPILLLLATTYSFRHRTAEQLADNPLDAQGIIRLSCNALAFALALNSLLFSKGRVQRGFLTTRPVRLYLLYAAVAVCGIATSVLPLMTGYRVMELLAVIAVVGAVYKDRGREGLQRVQALIYWNFVLLAGSVWIGFLLFPQSALDYVGGPIPYRIHGVYPWVSSNALGNIGITLFFWSLAKLLSPDIEPGPRPAVLKGIIAFGFISLIAAQYRTGYIAFFLVGFLFLIFKRKFLIASTVVAVAVGVLVFLPGVTGSATSVLLRGADFERAGRMSGRVTWWKLAIPVWQEKPWIGGGLQTASRFEVFAANNKDHSNIHSTWVEALVATGAIGITLLAASVLITWRRAAAAALIPGGTFAPLLLIGIMSVRSLTGGGFEHGGDTTFLYLAIAWGLTDPQKSPIRQRAARSILNRRQRVRVAKPIRPLEPLDWPRGLALAPAQGESGSKGNASPTKTERKVSTKGTISYSGWTVMLGAKWAGENAEVIESSGFVRVACKGEFITKFSVHRPKGYIGSHKRRRVRVPTETFPRQEVVAPTAS